jgi:hypothetical protein
MTHRSRICAVLIDTSAATHEPVARFWRVMADPGGHRFCVVPAQSAHWPEGAADWP